MANCLVTGGAGFIGSHTVEALLGRGHSVRVLDNFSTGALANLSKVRHEIEVLFGDLQDESIVQRAVQGIDLVFHLAVAPFGAFEAPEGPPPQALHAPETLHVLNAACKAKVKRVIYASSAKVYGNAPGPIIKETDRVLPHGAYALAKLAGEVHCVRFTYLYGLETVRLRYSNTFGPRQCPSSPYAQNLITIVKAMVANQPPVLENPASRYRDFIYIDDVVHATMLAAEASRVSGQVYNIGRGRPVNQLQIVALINEILGTQIWPIGQDQGAGTWTKALDISRAESELGFCPSIDLRQGLQYLLEYYAKQGGLSASPSQEPATEKPLPN